MSPKLYILCTASCFYHVKVALQMSLQLFSIYRPLLESILACSFLQTSY